MSTIHSAEPTTGAAAFKSVFIFMLGGLSFSFWTLWFPFGILFTIAVGIAMGMSETRMFTKILMPLYLLAPTVLVNQEGNMITALVLALVAYWAGCFLGAKVFNIRPGGIK